MKFFRRQFALAILALALCASQVYGADAKRPEENQQLSDRIEIVGQVPAHVGAELFALWETTVDSFNCSESAFLFKTHFSYTARVPVQLKSVSGNKRTWEVWRDQFLPGECKWQLSAVVAYADRLDSGLPIQRAANIPMRVAYGCLKDYECKKNTWAGNDDTSIPVHHYCKFSTIRNLSNQEQRNPCHYFDFTRHMGRADIGKSEHFLRTDHRLVNFVVVDLEDQSSRPNDAQPINPQDAAR